MSDRCWLLISNCAFCFWQRNHLIKRDFDISVAYSMNICKTGLSMADHRETLPFQKFWLFRRSSWSHRIFVRSKTLLSNVQPTYQSNLNHSQNNLNHLKRFNEFIFLKFDNRCFWFHQNRIVEGEKERESARVHICKLNSAFYPSWLFNH